jgi:hypothetical protein
MGTKMKKFIMGLLVGVGLMIGTFAFADEGLTKIETYLRPGLPITLDGKKAQLESPAVMVDGSTYLKLRDVAKLTGLGVNWNEDTQTVELSTKPVVPSSSSSGSVGSGSTTTITGGNNVSDDNKVISMYGFNNVIEHDGKYYIDFIEIMQKSKGLYFDPDPVNKKLTLKRDDTKGQVLIDSIPFTHLYIYWAVEYNYYLENIKPLSN